MFTESNRPLSMTLQAGLTVGGLEHAEALLRDLLRVPLVARYDSERGGDYLEYDAMQSVDTGIRFVDVRRSDDPHALGPRWPALFFVLEVTIGGTDLLELGRLAEDLAARGGDELVLLAYGITPIVRGPVGLALPRSHGLELGSPEDTAPRWRAGLGQADRSSTARGEPVRHPPLPSDAAGAPALLCHLTFGFSACSVDDTATRVADAFGVPLAPRDDPALGGRCFEHVWAGAAVGELADLLVRPNAVDAWHWLYPRHQEHVALLDVSLTTTNLLEPGRIAAFVEHRYVDAKALAYRVVGDLVGDRVPRMLAWERT